MAIAISTSGGASLGVLCTLLCAAEQSAQQSCMLNACFVRSKTYLRAAIAALDVSHHNDGVTATLPCTLITSAEYGGTLCIR